MEKFIKAATSDLLADAVPESLKNMLLVMETAGIFATAPTVAPDSKTTPILDLTWEKLDTFLPKLMPDLFGARPKEGAKSKIEAPASPMKGSEASVQPAIPKASSTPIVSTQPGWQLSHEICGYCFANSSAKII